MEQLKDVIKTVINCLASETSNMSTLNSDEFKNACDGIKDLAMADYYCAIKEAMEDPKNQYGEDYDEEGPIRKGYSTSRYPMMHREYENDMMPMRGYTDSSNMSGTIYADSGQMGYSEGNGQYRNGNTGRYESARRGYEEAKDIGSLNKIFDVIEEDMKELKGKMTGSDLATSKQRLMSLANML